MPSVCGQLDPPPPLWAGISVMPAQGWIELLVGTVICLGFIRHDWPRLLPGDRRRVITLCVLTWLAFFGSVFLVEVAAARLVVAANTWYGPALDRLKEHGCSTAPLEAMDRQLDSFTFWFTLLMATCATCSPAIGMAWRHARTRYLRSVESIAV